MFVYHGRSALPRGAVGASSRRRRAQHFRPMWSVDPGRRGVCEAMSRLRDGLAAVAALDRAAGTGVARSEELVELLAARERLDAVILAATGAWDRDKSWELDGARSPVAWVAHHAPVTRQEASSLVRTARHVDAFDQTAKALDAGDITASHV